MTEYVDLKGLCSNEQRVSDYCTALALKGNQVGTANRVAILAGLIKGYGAVVSTGPTGAAFWSLASPECTIRVVPDDYTYKYRTIDVEEWSYLAVGCSAAEVKTLLGHTPTARHHLYPKWLEAKALRDELERVQRTNPQPIVKEAAPYTILRSINEQLTFLSNLPEGVALDLEWIKDDGTLIGINASDKDTNWYLPVLAQGFSQVEYAPALLTVLTQKVRSQPTIWHQFKADSKLLADDPVTLFGSPAHDTILMAYVAGYQELGLKELTTKVLGRQVTSLPDNLEQQPMELAARYGAAGDSRNTYDLYVRLKAELEATEQWVVYNDIERPLVPLVASMEKLGFPLDIERVKEIRDDYAYTQQALISHVRQVDNLDISDTAHQHIYITQHYGYSLGRLDKRVLARIAGDWMDTLLGYRALETVRNNFLEKHINDYDNWSGMGGGRGSQYSAFPTFNQAGRDTESGAWLNAPATGRFSSAKPNLQNQPRAIRECFIAPRGYTLVALDYSGLELVVAAALSEDPVMLEVLRKGESLHDYMRQRIAEISGVDPGRPIAKNANFNLRYGGHADRLIEVAAQSRAVLDYALAKSIVDVDHATYVGYWNWYERVVDSARHNGYSKTLWGRRRYDANINSPDPTRRSGAERALANMVVQGTAADIIKIAMGRMPPVMEAYGAHMALQVHDELVFWVPTENAVAFKIAAKAVMESVQIPHLRLKVEGGIGERWSDAKA